jgi:hypothetical protein
MMHNEFDHLLTSVKALSRSQARQLRKQLDSQLAQVRKPAAEKSDKGAKRAQSAPPQNKPLSIQELHQQMMARGLITRLPDPALDVDDDDPDDQPVPIKGEPLPETIIRERR